jgi:long-chain fatty acid transport protein
MKKIILLTLIFVGLLFGTFLNATNGYFSHGYGAKKKGMAGAGTAIASSSLDSVSNPAALVFIGKRFDVGLGLFMPDRGYTVNGNPSMFPGTFPLAPGSVESGSKLFFMPHLGSNFMLNDKTSIGVAIYGNGGMNTNYDMATFNGSSPTGVNLAQLFVDLTLSRQIAENHALGLTGIFAYQMFSAEGLEAFTMFSRDGSNLTNRGTDNAMGFGYRIGYLGKFSKYVSIGASYQTEVKMQNFDKYAGLFAEQGGFDVPAAFNIGIAINPSDKLTFAFDVQQIMYSKINSVANPMNPMDFMSGILLGDDNGAGFGWEDMTILKFGVQYVLNQTLSLRAGFSTGDQPIPTTEVMFNILAPGVIEQHATFGGTFKLKGDKEFSFYIMHAFPNSIIGPNPMEAPNQQEFKIEMHQWEVGFEFKF